MRSILPTRARKVDRGETLAAEDARVKALRGGEDFEFAPATTRPPGPAVVGRLLFLEGPRAGGSVALGAAAVTLGSDESCGIVLNGDDGQTRQSHARIWLHGERFILRQVDGCETIVAGQPLTIPMVMLDHGDEIRIGAHRMRFEQNPGPVAGT